MNAHNIKTTETKIPFLKSDLTDQLNDIKRRGKKSILVIVSTGLFILPLFLVVKSYVSTKNHSFEPKPLFTKFSELNEYLEEVHRDSSTFKEEHLDLFFANYISIHQNEIEFNSKHKIDFHKTLIEIVEHNSNSESTFKMGINQFSYLNDKQKNLMLVNETSQSVIDANTANKIKRNLDYYYDNDFLGDNNQLFEQIYNCGKEIKIELSTFFKNLDWSRNDTNPSNKNLVTSIKDQGLCGSCYTFAAASVIEGKICAQNLKDCDNWTGISEQYILDCGPETYNFDKTSCHGGYTDKVFMFSKNNGIYEYTDYPYSMTTWKKYWEYEYDCENFESKNVSKIENFKMTNFCQATPKKVDEIKSILLKKGPIAAKLYAVGNLFHYRTGIYTPEIFGYNECAYRDFKDGAGYHEVSIVGYGHDEILKKDYWIVKNSWAETWGENGFGRIEAGRDFCGIESNIFYLE